VATDMFAARATSLIVTIFLAAMSPGSEQLAEGWHGDTS